MAANLGDPGAFHYKRSRRGERGDRSRGEGRAGEASGAPFGVEDFVPFGYDERQYCSPGFDLPVGSLTRTPWGRYPEYHTSADNLAFVQPEALAGSLRTYLAVMDVLEGNRRYLNQNPKCEPQLGRRGLYRTIGGDDRRPRPRARPPLGAQPVGRRPLSARHAPNVSDLGFAAVREAADALLEVGLLREVEDES